MIYAAIAFVGIDLAIMGIVALAGYIYKKRNKKEDK